MYTHTQHTNTNIYIYTLKQTLRRCLFCLPINISCFTLSVVVIYQNSSQLYLEIVNKNNLPFCLVLCSLIFFNYSFDRLSHIFS